MAESTLIPVRYPAEVMAELVAEHEREAVRRELRPARDGSRYYHLPGGAKLGGASVQLLALPVAVDGKGAAVGLHDVAELAREEADYSVELALVDLRMPGMDGLDVCRAIRAESGTPIVMLTAKGEERDVITGLDLGADDYITKPFSPRVLSARVKALLRRREADRHADEEAALEIHELAIHPGRHEVRLAGKPLELTYTEFALLHFLARRPGWAYTRTQIVDAVKGEDYPVTERSVDVQVAGLRKKLGEHAGYVETVRGIGYRFRA